jgi:hypothetical protein
MAFKSTGPIILEMAELLAQQKLIPFFGAGISRPHLGLAAEELARAMAEKIGADPSTLLSLVSDEFADKLGRTAFVEFLKGKLVVPTLDETKASTHRLLLSLNQNVLYTTNQDNIFELTAARYGRPYRRIVTLDDLSDALPGDRLLIKFHGDTDKPESLVFGARSYCARMQAEGHPLDIKLRADLLGKRLLFVGYSFSDENVAKLFDSVKRAFAGHIPPSYLIAFEYNTQMEELSRAYGITVVDPRRIFTEISSAAAAFERCLKALCDRTLEFQAQRGLETMFSSSKINPRMVTDYEVNAVATAFENGSFENCLNAFRGAFDQAVIPQPMQERVTELFGKLTDKVDANDDGEMGKLKGALFNFRLPPGYAVQATSFAMAACNRRVARDMIDQIGFMLCPAMPDHTQSVAAAMAVAILRQRNESISENFRRFAMSWFDGWDRLDPSIRDNVKQMIDVAWQGSGSSFTPINRPSFLPHKGFHEILTDLQNNLPARFRNPEG